MQTKSPRRGENLISSQARRLITVSVYLRSAYVKFLLQNFPFFSETFTLRICLFVQRLRPYHFTIRSCKQFQSSESLISGASRDCSTNILWIIKFVCSVYIRLNYASSHASSFFFFNSSNSSNYSSVYYFSYITNYSSGYYSNYSSRYSSRYSSNYSSSYFSSYFWNYSTNIFHFPSHFFLWNIYILFPLSLHSQLV